MNEHVSGDRLALYRARALPPLELVSVNSHIFACDQCFERLGSSLPNRAGEADDGIGDLEGEHHGDDIYLQMEAFVDGALPADERAAFEAHLNLCPACRKEAGE